MRLTSLLLTVAGLAVALVGTGLVAGAPLVARATATLSPHQRLFGTTDKPPSVAVDVSIARGRQWWIGWGCIAAGVLLQMAGALLGYLL